jgi:DNA-binding transcriptional LysR family regulator
MSVTMVGNHIRALEDRLGVRLLNRTTRKVGLTEIGKADYERSSQILNDQEEADNIATTLHSTARGSLNVNTNAHIIHLLAPVMPEFLNLNPAVKLDLSIGGRMVDIVENGYDLAIRALPPPDSSLIVHRLTQWRYGLCCTPPYLKTHQAPGSPTELVQHDYLSYSFHPYGDEWHFTGPYGQLVSVHVAGNVVTNSGETLRFLVLLGQGVFLAPSFVVANDLAEGCFVRPLPGYLPVEYAINAVYPHPHYLSTKVRSFIDLLAERFLKHRKWMDRGSAPTVDQE